MAQLIQGALYFQRSRDCMRTKEKRKSTDSVSSVPLQAISPIGWMTPLATSTTLGWSRTWSWKPGCSMVWISKKRHCSRFSASNDACSWVSCSLGLDCNKREEGSRLPYPQYHPRDPGPRSDWRYKLIDRTLHSRLCVNSVLTTQVSMAFWLGMQRSTTRQLRMAVRSIRMSVHCWVKIILNWHISK